MSIDSQETITITMKQAALIADMLQREVDDWENTWDEPEKTLLTTTHSELKQATDNWTKRSEKYRVREYYLKCEDRVIDARTTLRDVINNLEGWRPRSYQPETLADLHRLVIEMNLALEAFTHAIKPEDMNGTTIRLT